MRTIFVLPDMKHSPNHWMAVFGAVLPAAPSTLFLLLTLRLILGLELVVGAKTFYRKWLGISLAENRTSIAGSGA